MNLPYIKLFADNSATIDLLSDAEAGRLLKALMHYINADLIELPGQEKLIFAMLRAQIDRDAASYQEFTDRQRENGKKGGRPRKTQTNPKNPVVFYETQKTQEKEEEKEEEKDKEKDAVYTPAPAAHHFGTDLSDSEITASLETDRKIEDACRDWGLPTKPGNMIHARELAREYSLDWLLTAIERAGNGKSQTWSYVDGILRSFRANGGVDAPGTAHGKGNSEKRVNAQKYGQRDYTEDELLAVSDDLIAEARMMRGATA